MGLLKSPFNIFSPNDLVAALALETAATLLSAFPSKNYRHAPVLVQSTLFYSAQ